MRRIPRRDDDFFNYQAKLVNMVVANQMAWGIPPMPVAALVARRAEYEPLYFKAQEKKDRTAGDVDRHRQMRKIYEKEIQIFINTYLRYNPLVPRDARIEMDIPPRDLEPTPRGKIDTIPVVGLTAIGGGDIKTRCRVTTDSTRYSRHKLSDGIEVKYTWVPKGEMPPEGPEDVNKTLFSKKAQFIIHCGPKNAGESFYGFFRWVNLTNPENSGQWSNVIKVVIS
jgi:hypothetical protein